MRGECEFCATPLPDPVEEAENVALFNHLSTSPGCREQFGFMIDNTNASWTAAMSGGA